MICYVFDSEVVPARRFSVYSTP